MKKQSPVIVNLFGEEELTQKSLVIVSKGKTKLNKPQQTYNLLIRKIEKLRSELGELEKFLDNSLIYFRDELFPLMEEQQKSIRNLLIILFESLQTYHKILTATERKVIRKIIRGLLIKYMEGPSLEMDESLKLIFRKVNRLDFDKIMEEENALMEEERIRFEQDAEAADVQETSGTDDEGFSRFKKEKSASARNRTVDPKPDEETRLKNINRIYRQLAKVLHPDLERDETQKKEKEKWMQQLVEAFNNKDLHTLLKLEFTWIQKEENNPENLSEEKLSWYNETLKEQASRLKEELDVLPLQERYEALWPYLQSNGRMKETEWYNLRNIIVEATHRHESNIEELTTGNRLWILKRIVHADQEITKYAKFITRNFPYPFWEK